MNVYAGLDLGGSSLKYGCGNQKEGLFSFDQIKHKNKGREDILYLLSTAIKDIQAALSPENNLHAISLGSPGFIDHDLGEILGNCPNIFQWTGTNPKRYLESHFSIPVFVENDADLMALGESQLINQQQDALLGITIGTGIGSGFVKNGSIYHGSSYAAMELGHAIIERNGEQCSCGKRGCLETYTSIPAIEKQVESLIGRHLNIDKILQLEKDNHQINRVIKEAYQKLGMAIANAVVLLDPRVVVIGGGLTECPHFHIEPLKASIKNYLIKYHQDSIVIKQAELKNKTGVWGGIVLAERSIQQGN